MSKLQNSPKLPLIHARLHCNANEKNRSLGGHVLTGNESCTINIVCVIVDMFLY